MPTVAAPLDLLVDAEVYAPEPLGRCCVLVGGGRILHVGDRPAISGLDVREWDLAGRAVIPGLVDAHVHVTGGGGEAGPETAAPAPALSDYAMAGVTTVVGLLGTDDETRTTAGLLRQVRALRREGMAAWAWTGGYHLPPTTLTGSVRGDITHLDEVIGFGELAVSDHRSSQPTFDEVARIAADCHVAGLMTGKAGVLHLHVGDGARGLSIIREIIDRTEIPPRVLHPTHVNRRRGLLDEAFEITERGVTIDVTAFPPDDAAGDEVIAADALREYLDAGLPADRLTVSSDGGGCLPRFDDQGVPVGLDFATPSALRDLLLELVSGGMPLERALPPFTSNPATHLRLLAKGRIRDGADADLVVLDGGVTHVWASGRLLVEEGSPVVVGTFEAPPARPVSTS
jgi:beta-aspartyl-dipeptidase (metallo-type)